MQSLPVKTPETEVKEVKLQEYPSPRKSILRVNSTRQRYNYTMPWEKRAPDGIESLGAVVEGGMVLVTADVVTDATYISFSTSDKDRTFPARVKAIDYDANLALLVPVREEDAGILEEMIPLPVDETLSLTGNPEVWQFGTQGNPVTTQGVIQNYEMDTPLISGRLFLTYNMKTPMQSLENSYTMPVINHGKLAGMLLSYDQDNQVSTVLDISVIQSFIKDATDGAYVGFPLLGMSFTETIDPVFRKYLKLGDDVGGIYVSNVKTGGSAGAAGVRKGDVLLAINNHPIDRRGYYESPIYGKLEFAHLVNGESKVGEEVTLTIMRDGKVEKIPVKLRSSREAQTIIPDQLYDTQPPYIIYGGMVFTELSRPFIRSYGSSWTSRLSNLLVSAVLDPAPFEEKGIERIVVTSLVVPTPATLGYTGLTGLVVDSVNGKPVKKLSDVAGLLDDNKEDIQTITFGSAPYNIYFSRKKVEEVEPLLKEQLTPQLRNLTEEETEK